MSNFRFKYSKNLIPLFVTAFVFVAIAITVNSLSTIRDPRPHAATASNPATSISSSTFSCSTGSIHWSSPSSASASDNSYATVTTSTNKYTYCLRARAFGFNVPSGSTIDNIVIEIERKASHSGPSQYVRDNNISAWNGSTALSSNLCGNCFNEDVPTSDTSRTLTYASSKLTPSVINSSNFTISYQAFVTIATASVDQIKVTVNYTPPPPPPKVDLTASPTSISYNGSTTLSWTVSGGAADSCSASGGWSGSKSKTGGNQTISGLTSDTTFNINCSNSSGSDNDSVFVNVGSPPPPPDSGGGSSGGGSSGGGSSGGSGSSPASPISGAPTLPPPPPSIPGTTGPVNPNIVNFLELTLDVPYLAGNLKVPFLIGRFGHEIEVRPGVHKYELDVRGAKFKLGTEIDLEAGGFASLLTKKLEVKTKAPRQPVKIGNLTLGDVTGDNRIDIGDIESMPSLLAEQGQVGDINADTVINSMDYAIILVNFDTIGDR